MMKLRHLLLWVSIVCMGLPALQASAEDALPEYTVKAGFLYNFVMLTDWPSQHIGSTLEVCVSGSHDLLQALDSLRGKIVNNRRIAVRMLGIAEEVKDCHVLFLAESERMADAKILRGISGQPILTITDDEAIARNGAMIFLRPERQRLVFEINVGAAKNANLNISSRLLRLARGGASE